MYDASDDVDDDTVRADMDDISRTDEVETCREQCCCRTDRKADKDRRTGRTCDCVVIRMERNMMNYLLL